MQRRDAVRHGLSAGHDQPRWPYRLAHASRPNLRGSRRGRGALYHAGLAGTGCAGHKYGTASGFLQPSRDIHTLWNEGSVPLVVHAFYVLPPGTPNHVDPD